MISKQLDTNKPSGPVETTMPSNPTSFEGWKDTAIWEAYKNGNEAAYIYIYSKYVKTLFNYGCHCTPNHELVKDCIQDLFISLKNKKGFGQVASIKPYLFKSLRREIIRSLKKESRYSLKGNSDELQQFEVVLAWDEKIMQDQISQERKQTLAKGLTLLTPKQREAVVYFYYEGFTYEEISQIMNMTSAKTARKLIYRALDCLKLTVKGDDPGMLLMLFL